MQLAVAALLLPGTVYACFVSISVPLREFFLLLYLNSTLLPLELLSWSGETDWEFFDTAAQGLCV